MNHLEVRRHGRRKDGGGSQLSQHGVDQARALGSTMGPFACVVTTVVPRARETAIAMGFAVDYEIVTLTQDASAFCEHQESRWWETDEPFAALRDLVARGGPVAKAAHALAALWRDIVLAIPHGASALFIGHSGDLELALVACFPKADHAAWGRTFSPLEGARLTFDGDPPFFTRVEILRLATESR